MKGLIVRLLVVLSVPVFSLSKQANAGTVYTTAVKLYSDELIITFCLVMIVVGAVASILTPDPEGVPPTKPVSKFVYSVFGSLGAMFYIAHYEQNLSIVHPAWVGGVAFVAPAIIPSLKALVFELLPVAKDALKNWFGRWLGSKGGSNE
jgi:hypothetical protein